MNKQILFIQGPDPSPHEFPIFNVSHNPEAPYPNPINHLYDKRYKEAYSTFIKQNQATPAKQPPPKNEPPTPPTAPPKPNVQSPPYPTYPQGSFQRQTSKPAVQPPGTVAPYQQQPPIGWQFVNPYATMPRSQAAYYQQQVAKANPSTHEQPPANQTQSVRRSSTGEDIHSRPLSRSASSNDLNHATNTGAEKIRVRVINDNGSSSVNPQLASNHRSTPQRSILKPQSDTGATQETARTRVVYAPSNTPIGTETMQDLLKVVNSQRSEPPGSANSPMTERIIIIDRRGSSTPDNNQNLTGNERYRAFEIRSSTAPVASSTPTPTTTTATAATPATPSPSPSPATYVMPQNAYPAGQQLYYQQPKVYSSVPSTLYSPASAYVMGANNFYPYAYYRY